MRKTLENIEFEVKESLRLVDKSRELYYDVANWIAKYRKTRNEDYLTQARRNLYGLADFSIRAEAAVKRAASYFTTFRFAPSPENYDRAFSLLVDAREIFRDVDGWLVEATKLVDEARVNGVIVRDGDGWTVELFD